MHRARAAATPDAPRRAARQRRGGDPIDQPVVAHVGEPDDRGVTRQHRAGRRVIAQLLAEARGDLFDHAEIAVAGNLEVK